MGGAFFSFPLVLCFPFLLLYSLLLLGWMDGWMVFGAIEHGISLVNNGYGAYNT